MPGQNAGGARFDAAVMAQRQEEMLQTAVSMNIVTAEEAAVFSSAHESVDAIMVNKRGNGGGAGMDGMMAETLAELVTAGELTQADADTFLVVHDRLAAAGLMQ
jgi:hypothetical protein